MKTLRHWLFYVGSCLTALSIITGIVSWLILDGVSGYIRVSPSTYTFAQWCYSHWWVPEAIGITCLLMWVILFRWASPAEVRPRRRRQSSGRRR